MAGSSWSGYSTIDGIQFYVDDNSTSWAGTGWASGTSASSCNFVVEPTVFYQDFGSAFATGTVEEQEKSKQAEKIAEEFLSLHIGEDRFKKYKESGVVVVSSASRAKRTYKVDSQNRIEVYEKGKLIDRLCVNLVNETNHRDSLWLPEADVVLGKIFLLENDEERLLKVANHEQVL